MEDLNEEISPLKRVKKTSHYKIELTELTEISKKHENIGVEFCPVCSIKLNFYNVDPQVHINMCLDKDIDLASCFDESNQLVLNEKVISPGFHNHELKKVVVPTLESSFVNTIVTPTSYRSIDIVSTSQSQFINNVVTPVIQIHDMVDAVTPTCRLQHLNYNKVAAVDPKQQVFSQLKSKDFKQAKINDFFESDKKLNLHKTNDEKTNVVVRRFQIAPSETSGPNSRFFTKQSVSVKPERRAEMKKNSRKDCPFYKKIFVASISVDAFSYGEIPGCKYYLLSHFHSDHYKGLSKKFSGKVYCSKITANLVISQLHVCQDNVVVLPMNQLIRLGDVHLTLLDANHCPGSVMFLFEFNNKRILHVGDFRVHEDMLRNEKLCKIPINELYLDTTYCDPTYIFPPQNEIIDFVVKTARSFLQKNTKTLIVCGTYTIGKERVFYSLANELCLKIGVTKEKMKILKCLESKDLESKLTLDYNIAQVHVLPLFGINIKKLNDHMEVYKKYGYNHILAFKPTGWTYNASFKTINDISPVTSGNITIYSVPYSEHSSFAELKSFVQVIRPNKIIPTVNNGTEESRNKMNAYFESWLKST
ncbi:DNA cross-link repair 1A protein isoform X1 [Hydra vulgaris]|uniref:DNA cross-link repair 1A protein isoform X1 n=1 Tax=Hydra vulgaris TaxID=6087 RepID=UPI001F5F955D|nr:DNA cross-link repair 1A protein-like isoform X1 [Hydra vulgaris]